MFAVALSGAVPRTPCNAFIGTPPYNNGLSIFVLEKMLEEMEIALSESDKRILYSELTAYFGIIGGYGECERLERLWGDPVYRREIERYIRAWVRYRKKREYVEIYA